MIRTPFGVVGQVLVIALVLTPGSIDAQERLLAVDSVGSSLGDDSFGRIVDIAVSPEGRLAVSQFALGEVWVFGPDGGRQVVGRSGQGPGEFGIGPALAWRSDTLVAVEKERQRISLVASDGRYLGGLATVRSAAAVGYGPIGYLRTGLAVATPFARASRETPTGSFAGTKPLILVDADDQVADSIGALRARRVLVLARLGSGGTTFAHPLPNFTRTALSPDGRYLATADELEGRDGSELRFTLYDAAGKELGRTTANIVTDPASDEDVLDPLARLVEAKSRDHPEASVRKSILDAVELPDRLPALSSFLLDNAGWFWVGSKGKDGGTVWRAWSIEDGLERTWGVEPGLDVRQIHDGGAVAIRQDDVRGWRVIHLRPQGQR